VLSVTGNNAIIDWVFVELRNPSVPSTILYTRSALLQADGDIVDVDGVSPLVFLNVPANNYYLGIRHRNHLIIQTTAAISFVANTIKSVDFSDKIANISTSKMNELDNLKVMRGGDLNNNGDITAFDVSKVRQANVTGQSDSYKNEDVNMNGQATAFDVSIVRRNNKPN
jgi:Dockerin type I domain